MTNGKKIKRRERTHQVNVGCYVSQNAVFPVETTCPFAPVLLWHCVYAYSLPVLDGPSWLGAVEVMNPLVLGDFAGVGQLAGQCHGASFLWRGAAVNWEKNKTVKFAVDGKQRFMLIKIKPNPRKLTFGNDKLHISSQPLSFYSPGASVPACILKSNLFQTGRLIHREPRGGRGRRERCRKATGSESKKRLSFQFLPECARGD